MKIFESTEDISFSYISYYIPKDPYVMTHVLYERGKRPKDCIFHSEVGPAVITIQGERYYYLHGKSYNFFEWLEKLTHEQQILALYNPENF